METLLSNTKFFFTQKLNRRKKKKLGFYSTYHSHVHPVSIMIHTHPLMKILPVIYLFIITLVVDFIAWLRGSCHSFLDLISHTVLQVWNPQQFIYIALLPKSVAWTKMNTDSIFMCLSSCVQMPCGNELVKISFEYETWNLTLFI